VFTKENSEALEVAMRAVDDEDKECIILPLLVIR